MFLAHLASLLFPTITVSLESTCVYVLKVNLISRIQLKESRDIGNSEIYHNISYYSDKLRIYFSQRFSSICKITSVHYNVKSHIGNLHVELVIW
jgi:hypothetical protein